MKNKDISKNFNINTIKLSNMKTKRKLFKQTATIF